MVQPIEVTHAHAHMCAANVEFGFTFVNRSGGSNFQWAFVRIDGFLGRLSCAKHFAVLPESCCIMSLHQVNDISLGSRANHVIL